MWNSHVWRCNKGRTPLPVADRCCSDDAIQVRQERAEALPLVGEWRTHAIPHICSISVSVRLRSQEVTRYQEGRLLPEKTNITHAKIIWREKGSDWLKAGVSAPVYLLLALLVKCVMYKLNCLRLWRNSSVLVLPQTWMCCAAQRATEVSMLTRADGPAACYCRVLWVNKLIQYLY